MKRDEYPSKNSQTVKIPVRVVQGRVEFYFGGELPDIQDGVIGDLVIPAYSIKDPTILAKLSATVFVQLLPKGTILLMQFQPSAHASFNEKTQSYVNLTYRQHIKDHENEYSCAPPMLVAEVILREDLRMLLRGTKLAELGPCRCFVPLLDQEAQSLNRAYTLLSEVLEPERLSHTGNVFVKSLFRDSRTWRQLDDLRDKLQSSEEEARFRAQ